MGNIIVIECKSTGINFIEDIVNMGHNPIIMETKIADTEEGKEYENVMKRGYANIKHDFELIQEKDTYEETLEMVKGFEPILILPANEKGVRLATKLAYDLNLLCNSIENLDAMTLKHEMQNRLAERGLRSIKGKNVTTLEDAIDFYDNEGLRDVVIKPVYSAGSASVRICANKEELIEAFGLLLNKTNYFGDENIEFLIQERIVGEEYIVNTVSCEGQHRVTTVWKYEKLKTNDGAMVYDAMYSVNELNPGEAEMIEYAYKVADALEIEYGPVHGEYMVDENGPVLIEVNCRPMGGNMDAEFLNRVSGQHETDSVLYSYLKPDLFKEQLKKPYQLYAFASLKFLISPRDIVAKSAPMKNISSMLKSHFKTSLVDIKYDDKKLFFKTEDLDTSPGTIYLVHEDPLVVKNDIDFLRNVEKNAFALVLSSELHDIGLKDDETYAKDIKPLAIDCERYGIGLLVTDQFVEDVSILQVKPEDVGDVFGKFDFIIINLNKTIFNNHTMEVTELLLDCLSRIKNNGIVFIPENSYQLLDGGRSSMEALIKAAGLKIELPPYTVCDVILASRG